MKIKTTAGLFAVWALALLVAACPNENGGTPEPNESGPKFTGLSLSGSKILVIFDKALSDTPDATKITVKKGEATLAYDEGKDYTLSIEGKNLVITLKTTPAGEEQYTVELQAGAVQDASGKNSEAPASSAKTTLTVGITPVIQGSLAFKADSNTVLELGFNTPVAIADSARIKVETKAATAKAEFTAVNATIKVSGSDSTKLEITLGSAATNGNTYHVKVEAGGLRAISSELVNGVELSSTEVSYSTSPVLSTAIPPYILENTIIATFSREIALKSDAKVKVQKKTTAAGSFAPLTPTGTIVDTADKTRLKVTLLAVANNEVYRLSLEAGAINEDGKAANENKAITPTNLDITIAPAPALVTDAAPVFKSETKFSVSFQADVALLNAAAIKVESKKGADEYGTVSGRSIAVDSTDAKKINFTLSQAVDSDKTWKVTFPVESVATPGRVANTAELTTNETTPKLSDIYNWTEVLPTGGKVTSGDGLNWWTERNTHISVVFDGKIWVLGGKDTTNTLNEVWSSADGLTWTESQPPGGAAKATSGAGLNWWTARSRHTSVMFKDKIWVMGGISIAREVLNDVWNSADGSTWTRVDDAANWAAHYYHTSVVFDDGGGEKLWVLGGTTTNVAYQNDVWSSADGLTWTESQPPKDNNGDAVAKDTSGADANWWIGRYDHTSVVFDGKIWVLGGNLENEGSIAESWYSTDAKSWTKAKDINRAFSAHASVVYDGHILNLGGDSYTNSVSSSVDPTKTWVAEKAAAWTGRSDFPAVVFKGKIWILGGIGTGSTYYNDVWTFGPDDAK